MAFLTYWLRILIGALHRSSITTSYKKKGKQPFSLSVAFLRVGKSFVTCEIRPISINLALLNLPKIQKVLPNLRKKLNVTRSKIWLCNQKDRKQPDRKFIKSAFGIANTKAYLKENTCSIVFAFAAVFSPSVSSIFKFISRGHKSWGKLSWKGGLLHKEKRRK